MGRGAQRLGKGVREEGGHVLAGGGGEGQVSGAWWGGRGGAGKGERWSWGGGGRWVRRARRPCAWVARRGECARWQAGEWMAWGLRKAMRMRSTAAAVCLGAKMLRGRWRKK